MFKRSISIALLLLMASTAHAQAGKPISAKPSQQFIHKGFSVQLLSERGWLILQQSVYRLALAKRGRHRDETYAIMASVVAIPEIHSKEAFLAYVKKGMIAGSNSRRFNKLKGQMLWYDGKQDYCARFHLIVEDHEAVTQSGKQDMILEVIGLVCRHPNQKSAVHLTYSNRYYPGNADANLPNKASTLFDKLEFTDL